MTTSSELFNVSPYFDDYDSAKKFLRMLFRPGFAVQGRELTQLQTLLQTQVERFGSHIFKDGSKVFGSNIADQNVKFLRVEPTFDFGSGPVDLVPANFVDFEVSSVSDPNLKAKVFYALDDTVEDPFVILFIEYISSGTTTEFQPGDELLSSNGVTLTKAKVKNVDVDTNQIQDDFIDVTGKAILASIDEGIFYIDGFFVVNDKQRIAPFRLSALNEPTLGAPANVRLFSGINARVGFDISKDIVAADDDSSLLDPAFGSPNFNAPGADRFRIRLLIDFKLFVNTANTPAEFSDEDFVEWMRIKSDIVVIQAVRPDYSALQEVLAERTQDINGSFTVRAFHPDVRPHQKRDLYVLTVSAQVGTFLTGEDVVGGTSGAVGFLDFITDFDLSFLMQSGNFVVAETITGQTSGATAAIDTITFQEDTNGVFNLAQGGEEDSIAFGLEPGKAYVQGYLFETLATEFVKVDKARDTQRLFGFNINTNFGGYVLVDSNGDTAFENWNFFVDIDSVSTVSLRDASTPTPLEVGTARVRQVLRDSSIAYRVYLFDLSFNVGRSIADVREIHQTGTFLWKIREPEGISASVINRLGEPGTIHFESANSKLIFPVPVGQSTEKFFETDWRSEQQFTVPLNASGIGSVATGSPKIRFVGGSPTIVSGQDLFHYTVIDTAANIVDLSAALNQVETNNNAPLSNGQVTLTIPSLPSQSVTLIATLDVNDSDIVNEPLIRRNKVLTKGFVVPTPITLSATFRLADDLSDNFTDGETVTGGTSGATGVVDSSPDKLTARVSFTFSIGDGPFVFDDTFTGVTSTSTAKFNDDFITVDANLTSTVGSFFPGELVYEGVSLTTATAIAVAITSSRFRFIEGMFSNLATITGNTSLATAVFNVTFSTYEGAIFDMDSTTTGVFLQNEFVNDTFGNQIQIGDIINYTGSFMDMASGVFVAGETLTGGTSGATATLEAVETTGEVPLADIFGVVSITDDGNTNTDVTNAFFVDNGQRDNLYDWGSVEYDPLSGVLVVGPFTITVNYFEHIGDGPLYVNSYTHTSPGSNLRFENIPLYTSPQTGETVALRDVVDFRPLRNPSGTIVKIFFPKTGEAFDADYSFHLPRIDKIILRKELRFDVIRGIPSLQAEIPADDPHALTLYIVKIPPYTYNVPQDLSIRYIENKRFTMSDIGNIEKRVQRLEYYTSLTLLERETDALTITDAAGADRFKNGILVDSFQGHSVGDVLNQDYDVAIDFEKKELRPPFIDRPINLSEVGGSRFNLALSPDGLYSLSYTETSLVFQPLASSFVSVNPFNVVSWMGKLSVDPSSDTWVDTETRPEVRVNLEGENDAWAAVANAANGALPNGFGTEWGSWESHWTGKTEKRSTFTKTSRKNLSKGHASKAPDGVIRRKVEDTTTTIERTVEDLTGTQTRQGIQTRVVPERIERSLGNRVVDVSIVPFIRTQDLNIDAEGMKPNTQVYPFFDNVNVSQFATPFGGSLGDDVFTDSAGKVTDLTFSLPQGRFKTGERLFRLTDEPNNIVANSLTSSEASWNALGLLQTREETIVSTRVPILRRQTVTQDRPAHDVRTRDRTVKSQTEVRWVDPLAQTFLVDRNLHPNGVFLTSIDLFFRTKDANIPVSIQIRPVVNGYPHASLILPFSEVSLDSASVNTSTNPDPSVPATRTRFTFSSPVFLAGGEEYALVVLSNSNEYLAYIATIGQNQIGSENRISTQPYAGSMFRSQNASTWTADQTSDLMFAINRAKFDTVNPGQVDFRNVLTVPVVPASLPNDAGLDEMYLLSSQLQFPDSTLTLSVDSSPTGILTGQFRTILANQREKFTSQQVVHMTSNPASFNLRAQFRTSDDAISPIIDLDRLTVIAIENEVNDSANTNLGDPTYNGELEPLAFTPANGGALARYISRIVTLEPGFESTDFKVFVTANKPIETDIQVFVKVQPPEEEADFATKRYTQLQPVANVISENEDDFREIKYELPVEFSEPFNRFAVKITLYSTNTSVAPRVRDMRAIAVI